MWVKKDLVKLMLLLQFFILSTSSSSLSFDNNAEYRSEIANENENGIDEALPNIWEDEVIARMVREVIARDLVREHDFKRTKRQYKRDLHSSPSSSAATATGASYNTLTTRKMTAASTQKAKKPSKVTQTGNKIKNRVTSASITTKATVKPHVKPSIVSSANLGSVNASSKIKVRIMHAM